jgi:hypothetical protein
MAFDLKRCCPSREKRWWRCSKGDRIVRLEAILMLEKSGSCRSKGCRLKSRSQGGKAFMQCFKKSEGMGWRLSRRERNLIELSERSRVALRHQIKKRSLLGTGRPIERILN